MPSPPNCPGGRLIECSTTRSTTVPWGRGPKFGESLRFARHSQPARHSASLTPTRSLAIRAGRVGADVDVEPRHAIAHLAQRQAEADPGGGAGEAVVREA